MLELWNFGISKKLTEEFWNLGTLEFWTFGISQNLTGEFGILELYNSSKQFSYSYI